MSRALSAPPFIPPHENPSDPNVFVCVGGILHGQIVRYEGRVRNLSAVMRVPEEWQRLYEKMAPSGPDLRVWAEQYVPREVGITLGTLRLTGRFLMWERMEEREALTAAMGLCLAAAMRASESPSMIVDR